MTRLKISLLCALALSFSGLRGQTATVGGMPGAPFRMGFGARAMGSGNAFSTMLGGDVVAYYNPALVPFQAVPVLSASYGFLSLDRQLNYLSYTRSLKPTAGLSVGLINAGVSNIDARDEDGTPNGTLSTSENDFYLSFGILLRQNLSIGITTKILYYKLYQDIHSTTVGVDFGLVYRITEALALGAVVQDIGSKYKWDTTNLYGESGTVTEDRFPVETRIAVSYSPPYLQLAASAEYYSLASAGFWRLGCESPVVEGFYLRGGIDQISLSGAVDAKPSIGFSVVTEAFGVAPRFDYAYIFEPYSPTGIHLLGLNFAIP